MSIARIWGHRDLSIPLNRDVTILVGENGSGKTTVLNLMRHALSVNLRRLTEYDFEEVKLSLKSFHGDSQRTVSIRFEDDICHYEVSGKEYPFDVRRYQRSERRRGAPLRVWSDARELRSLLSTLVPAVWLPVTRRLPLPEPHHVSSDPIREPPYGSRRRPPQDHTESVDERLDDLLDQLRQYRYGLERRLTRVHKDFEQSVLALILYDPDIDSPGSPPSINVDADRSRLMQAFRDAGLLSPRMRKRIEEHFDVATRVLKPPARGRESDVANLGLSIIPLLKRTQAMVNAAEHLEEQRKQILAPIERFKLITSKFFRDRKQLAISDRGELTVTSSGATDFSPDRLSSGEKQLIILLVQALLTAEEPVVYVVDEPELSLHVSWQEQLLGALLELGGQIQLVVATHSPDIVADFDDRLVELTPK